MHLNDLRRDRLFTAAKFFDGCVPIGALVAPKNDNHLHTRSNNIVDDSLGQDNKKKVIMKNNSPAGRYQAAPELLLGNAQFCPGQEVRSLAAGLESPFSGTAV